MQSFLFKPLGQGSVTGTMCEGHYGRDLDERLSYAACELCHECARAYIAQGEHYLLLRCLLCFHGIHSLL